jgi:hypothetical protein
MNKNWILPGKNVLCRPTVTTKSHVKEYVQPASIITFQISLDTQYYYTLIYGTHFQNIVHTHMSEYVTIYNFQAN